MVEAHVRSFLHDRAIRKDRCGLLIGVSGGLDSIVLCRVMGSLGYPARVAHVNYGLRPSAQGDEQFVQAVAKELGFPLHVLQAKKVAMDTGSLQENARELRYQYFAELAKEYNLRHVAVAHHADDQAETVLMQLFRGTGIEGLRGMSSERALHSNQDVRLIRPLLELSKSEIRIYAQEREWEWREDPSNKSQAYFRNAVRHHILPIIEKHAGEHVRKKLAHTARIAQGYWTHTLQPDLERRLEVCRVEGEHALLTGALRDQPTVWRDRIILEALHRWLPDVPKRAAVAQQIARLLPAQPGRMATFEGGTIWRERGKLFFEDAESSDDCSERVLHAGESVEINGFMITAESMSAPPLRSLQTSRYTAWLSAEKIHLPLVVRTWRHGDYIQPLGMDGTKTVSDLLTDDKVPPHEKSTQLVVEDEEAILWVVGRRVSERAKLDPDNGEAVRLHAEKLS